MPAPPLPRTVRALGWTSFLTDLSSEAIYPLLPAFMLRELGGSAISVGLVDGVANAIAAIVRLPSGAASDWLGRRPLILGGYGISAAVRPLMGLVISPLGALLVRAADRFGKGIRSAPRDALVADLVAPEIRGRAFGHIRALDHAGAALGPLVAMLFLLFFPGRERTLFLLAILPGLATLVVIWWLVRDAPTRTPVAVRTALEPRLDRRQWPLLTSVGIWALGASSEQFLLLRAADLGVPAALVPLVWLGMSLAKSGSATYAGRLADRWHPRAALATGWLAFAAAYAGLAASSHLAAALPLLLLVGVAYGIAEPAERALVARLAPVGRHGSAFGWYALVQGVMALPAGLLAGWLWQQGPQGPAWALAATAILSTLACGLLMAGGREQAGRAGLTAR
ncbi:MAG: MFS transporter [Planctomycetota bacterium]